MTDPILYLIEATTLTGTVLVLYLYVFSGPLREVTASANYNFVEWLHGRWSIRTGAPTVSSPPPPTPKPAPELE